MIQFYIKDTHGGGVLHLKHNCKEFELYKKLKFFSSTFWLSWQFCELHQGLPNTDKSKEPASGHSFGTNKLCDPENVPSPLWITYASL